MRHTERNAAIWAVPVLLAAVMGFLLGATSRSAAPPSITTPVSGKVSGADPVVLEYSAPGWSTASQAPAVPGLALADELVLSPGGGAAGTVLIAGRGAKGDPGPLPAGLLARLREPPKAEVVSLLEAQAYRYRRLAPTGFDGELTLYAVPNRNGSGITVVCYARRSPRAYAQLGQCERLVSTLTLALNSDQYSFDLTPDPQYAQHVSDVVGTVDRERVALRAAMHTRASSVTLSRLARRLAGAFAGASRSLLLLQPPLAAGRAQAALTGALASARDGYLALARASGEGDGTAFSVARARVYATEARFAAALSGYALLGYA